MGTANMQGQLWGGRARDWAEVQEGMFKPLFDVILEKTAPGPSTQLLDVGCGAGMFCQMAASHGAHVSGLDAAEPLLAIARERTPQGDFKVGEMEELTYNDESFDLVTGFNSFQFAANPVNALKEARRVMRKDALLVIGIWGQPHENESVVYLTALGSLLPAPPPGTPGPLALSADGALEALVTQAGFTPTHLNHVDCLWHYPDEETLLRGLLSAGPSIRAIQHVGEDTVRETVLKTHAPFRTTSGQYQLKNKAQYLIAHV